MEGIEGFAAAFGAAIVVKDEPKIQELTAPWLDAADVLAKFELAFDDMLAEWEMETGQWPVDHSGGTSPLGYEDLRRPSSFPPGIDIPEEVTDANYAGWTHVTFHPDEDAEFDAFCDAWIAAVTVENRIVAGSLEIVDPD